MKIRLAAVLCSLFVIAGCGGDDETEQEAASTPAATATETAAPPVEPVSKDLDEEPMPVPSGEPPAELVVEDVVKGKGKAAKAGDVLAVQYTGISFSTGTKFDASWDRGAQPFEFPLGQQRVIAGWDEGIVGMKEGGRRQLTIPPDLAYGPSGTPDGSIAPNETLIFVVDLVKIG